MRWVRHERAVSRNGPTTPRCEHAYARATVLRWLNRDSHVAQVFHTLRNGDRSKCFIASEIAWDAILASVPPPDPVRPTTRIRVSPSDLDAVVGTYEFPSGARVDVSRTGEQLRTTLTGSGGMFFAVAGNTLVPVAPREFLIDGPRNDRVRFEERRGQVVTMTLNPGQWAQLAKRVP